MNKKGGRKNRRKGHNQAGRTSKLQYRFAFNDILSKLLYVVACFQMNDHGIQRGAELLKPFNPGLGKKSLWLIRLGQKMYQDFVKSAVFIFTKTLHAFFYQ